jgi:hypothetical protein
LLNVESERLPAATFHEAARNFLFIKFRRAIRQTLPPHVKSRLISEPFLTLGGVFLASLPQATSTRFSLDRLGSVEEHYVVSAFFFRFSPYFMRRRDVRAFLRRRLARPERFNDFPAPLHFPQSDRNSLPRLRFDSRLASVIPRRFSRRAPL